MAKEQARKEMIEADKRRNDKAAQLKARQEAEDAIFSRDHAVYRFHGRKEPLHLDKRSLWICKGDWWTRKGIVWFVHWKWFDRVIILSIVLNSLLLAFTDYKGRIEEGYESERNA
jgi:hypothetical protein